MKGINTTIITGNIGSAKVISNGEDVSTSVSVAVDDSYKLKDQQEWTKRTIWVEAIFKGDRLDKLTVGRQIGVQGKISAGAYINKEGQPVGTLRITNAKLTYLDRLDETDNVEEMAEAEG